MPSKLKEFLDKKVEEYNQPSFIHGDPISIPHLFSKKQDIEIAGFFAAIFSWGNRTTIINKSKELMMRMDNAPFQFVVGHSQKELKGLRGFKHRTFNEDDLFYFVEFFKLHFKKHKSLETAFFPAKGMTVEKGLINFRNNFFSSEHLKRTEKHISSPTQKSTCKRLNMFLRWMVRNDKKGVDFGIWSERTPSEKNILPAELICPLDVHVARVARKLNLLHRKQNDWQAATELTEALRKLDNNDPVKYDFALFNLGVIEKF